MALRLHQQALELALHNDDVDPVLLLDLGDAMRREGRFIESLSLLDKAAALCSESADPAGVALAITLTGQGLTFQTLVQFTAVDPAGTAGLITRTGTPGVWRISSRARATSPTAPTTPRTPTASSRPWGTTSTSFRAR